MTGMANRRWVCIGLASALGGCGFQPIYMPTASGKAGVAQRDLSSVYVNIIPDRPGQLLRQALQERFGNDSGTKSDYDLSVTFSIAGEGIAVEANNIATRMRLIGNASWTLQAHDPKRTRADGRRCQVDRRREHLPVAIFRRRPGDRGGTAAHCGDHRDPDRDPACGLVPPAGGKTDGVADVKLPPARIYGFLRDPGDCRVVLLYGDDAGMIRERAEALVRAVAGSLDDPFLVTDLTRDEIRRLPDEAAGLSLIGGRRVVRVRDVTDAAADPVQVLLKTRAPALVVLEGPSLASRSKLRTALEAAADGAAIGCYPEEGRALEDTIRETLRANGAGVEPDALSWLAQQLGADRASTRAELAKLALYVGAGQRVDLDAAMTCVGDLAGLSLDDALFAATTGDVATADRALEAAVGEGAAPVQVLRAALGHLQRLHRARLAMDEQGLSAADAVKGLRPPVFYQKVGAFSRSLGLWPAATLAAAMAAMAEAERGCKRTGWPDHVLCRNAVLTLARRAAVASRSSRR